MDVVRPDFRANHSRGLLRMIFTARFYFSSQGGGESKTTFDDLMDSLKQLEEQPADLMPEGEREEPKYGGWG